MSKTKVVFRKWPDGDIDALFPDLPANNLGNITCYSHIGQHSAATYLEVLRQTVPAKPEEYASLQKELESRGYDNIQVMQRNQNRKG